MGTNYYAVKNTCKCCDRKDDYHLGKASGGWAFCFQAFPELGITDFSSWAAFVRSAEKVVDEYGDEHDKEAFIEEMRTRQGKKHAEEHPIDHDWLDPDGHSFTSHWFS